MSEGPPKRSLAELRDVADPAWPIVLERLGSARNSVELLRGERPPGERCMVNLQAPASTILGAIALHAGGLLVDGGWLRLYGSGHPRMRGNLLGWNGGEGHPGFAGIAGALIVGSDVLGGVFAINGGGLPGGLGEAVWWDPASQAWTQLETNYPGLVSWALDGDMGTLYADRRWPDWDRDVAALTGDQGIWRDPPPWREEGPALSVEVLRMAELIGRHWRSVDRRARPVVEAGQVEA